MDGYVLFIGEMPGDEKVEQIKGMTYELPVFLGRLSYVRIKSPHPSCDLLQSGENVQVENPENKLYQCIFYLAPGDYHGIHAPVDLTITEHKHFPGTLYSPLSRSLSLNLSNYLFALTVTNIVVIPTRAPFTRIPLGSWAHNWPLLSK